jgi:nitrite reductase/ring-hydroxylating ferredoxin subunit
MKTDVGSMDEFVEGSIRVVDVDGQEIGIARWKGELFAVANECPDQLGPLCEGALRPLLTTHQTQGTIVVDESVPVVACPWHFWEFDLRTGIGLRYGSRAKIYRTDVSDGRVFVMTGPGARAADA